MNKKIIIKAHTRPCIVGEDTKALLHGLTKAGDAMVELENGKLYKWDISEVRVLDSLSEFKQWPWDLLIKKVVDND